MEEVSTEPEITRVTAIKLMILLGSNPTARGEVVGEGWALSLYCVPSTFLTM